MIVGTGLDLVDIERISRNLARFGARFIQRVLTEREREDMPSGLTAQARHLASRFAAKEAAVKALGTGFAQGIGLHDVEILTELSGKPKLCLHKKAGFRARELGVTATHISLTHEKNTAGAMVILEATPRQCF